MVRFAALALVASSVALVSMIPSAPVAAKSAIASRAAAAVERGRAFAQARCAGCHAVEPNQGSPNPEAPSFEAVANQRGLTRLTLRRFLRNSHNYPAAMNFRIDAASIDDLSAYVVTLKSPRYRPAI